MLNCQNASIDQIKSIIAEKLGVSPAYWAPGVTALGWSFNVFPGKVVVNRLLGPDYRMRVRKGLKAAFTAAGMDVKIETDDSA